MAFILGAVIGAGASLVGGAMASSAASKAAKAQQQAAQSQLELQRQMWRKQLELQAPFREAGLKAQNRLMDLLGLSGDKNARGYGSLNQPFGQEQFNVDPGYKFRLSEGLKALDATAAARGGLMSGNALRGAAQYGQELGSQEFRNAYDRYQTNRANILNPLQAFAGQAQSSANVLGAAAQNYAGQGSDAIQYGGNAAASGYTGAADAWNRALGGAAGTAVSGLNAAKIYGQGGYNPYSNYANMAGGGQVPLPPIG